MGLLLTPWGARRERIRESVRRSVLRSLRHTPHPMLAFVVSSLIALPLFRANSKWQSTAWGEVDRLAEKMMEEGEDSEVAWERAWSTVRSQGPFFTVYGEAIGSGAYFAGGLWFLWGILGAIGAAPMRSRTAPEGEDAAPLCEACGYNLIGIPMEGRCPECGEYVVQSLGPDARPGTPWQRRAGLGRWDSFWKTAAAALVRPTALGRQLIPSPDRPHHAGLMLLWCTFAFVISGFGFLACYLATFFLTGNPVQYDFLWFVFPIGGFSCAIGILLFCIASAGFVGLLSSCKHKRNMLPAAMQAVCAAGGLLPVWLAMAFVGWASSLAIGILAYQQNQVSAVASIISLILSLGPSAVCLPLYLWLIARIARGARFANQ